MERLLAGLGFLLVLILGGLVFAQPDVGGHWEGVIGPDSLNLGIRVDFEVTGGLSGTIDIPAQGAAGLLLDVRFFEGSELTFAIAGIPGDPTFSGTLVGSRIEGTFTQAGRSFPFFLTREAVEAPGLERPQEPKPPFPYRQEEVSYAGDGVTLAGTLSLPRGDGPFPALLLVTGSGAQNRNEEIVGHKPFLVISDHLTRAGYAVLRMDDRGVGGSSGELGQANYDDLVADILAGIAFLEGRGDIDGGRLGLLGHSEGGYLAPLAASRSRDVAFVIMLAGPSVPGIEVLKVQNDVLLRLAGASDEQMSQQQDYLDALYRDLRDEDYDAATTLVRERIGQQLAALPEEQRPDAQGREALMAAQVAAAVSPVFRAFITYDPRPALQRLEVPVLAIYGQQDVQVPPVQSVGPLRAALRRAGNEDVTIRVFPQLNHLMQTATTGAIEEYGTITETISPQVLDTITSWLQERFQ